ncbi:hypothetical protein DSO57_1000540 [Entomophthora muscae]|uniref:Uncharacterized protein n=1 Tax=Entomophthora muscae TaxID=34485 RepID=A0ACC2RPG9_9FUNG|nr:hypothetical protein DSO57_1000540 [Entomophthora muscae]
MQDCQILLRELTNLMELWRQVINMMMVGLPVKASLVNLNLGVFLQSIGEKLPNEWVPDT